MKTNRKQQAIFTKQMHHIRCCYKRKGFNQCLGGVVGSSLHMYKIIGPIIRIQMKVKHEYVITEDLRPNLRPELEHLLKNIERGLSYARFEFEWVVGSLNVRSSEELNSEEEIFADAPRYRVSTGRNRQLLQILLEDLLDVTRSNLDFVRSIEFSGLLSPDNVVNIEKIQIVESSIPVPTVIDVSNPRSVSPLKEWDGVRVGIWLDNPVHIRSARDGPLRGFAHLTEDRTRFLLTHQTFGSERLFLYTFESPNQSLRVLDPISPGPGPRLISLVLIEVMCFVFLAQTLRKFGLAQHLVFVVMATLFFASFLHRYQWTE